MLILILIDVQYLQKAVFSFEKCSNGQNCYSSSPHHLIKKFPPTKISDSLPAPPPPLGGRGIPPPLNTIWKTLDIQIIKLNDRTLRIVYDDYESSFEQLLIKDNCLCIHHQNIHRLMI